jgi:hypothetical protein
MSIHNHKSWYCSLEKREFAPKGWPSHVKACEPQYTEKQWTNKVKQKRTVAFQELQSGASKALATLGEGKLAISPYLFIFS